KVYFPRLVIPLSAVGAGLVDLAVAFTVLLALMLFYATPPSWALLLVPLLLLGTVLAAAGVGSLLAALTVAYRDFRYVVPFLIQLWMFVTPVIYPVAIVPPAWRPALALNPMAGLIDGFRSAFLARPIDWLQVACSLCLSSAIFFVGTAYFRKTERRFADII